MQIRPYAARDCGEGGGGAVVKGGIDVAGDCGDRSEEVGTGFEEGVLGDVVGTDFDVAGGGVDCQGARRAEVGGFR